jgi:hypothetical protein
MRFNSVLCLGILGGLCMAQADTLTTAITPPGYTDTGRLADGSPYYFHDDQWAAFAFIRLPSCVPPDFNLLDGDDFVPAFPGGPPRVFLCALTVEGHAILKNPGDFIPVQAVLKGLGAVPVWFVKVSDVQAIVAGTNKLTTAQLLASSSLRKGLATERSGPVRHVQPSGRRQWLDRSGGERLAGRRDQFPARMAGYGKEGR